MSEGNSRSWPDDETLMAFVDGTLDGSETERVARHLEADDEARRFVERLIVSAELAKVAFDEVSNNSDSDRKLAQIILRDTERSVARGDDNVVPLPSRSGWMRAGSRFALPLAASMAL